jgi:transcriptional regulator with XRE-family HTH domain
MREVIEMYEDLRGLPFCIKIQTLRHRKGLLQKELAKEIGCTAYSVNNWENDRCFPMGIMLEKLRLFYELPVDFFIEDRIAAIKSTKKKKS